MNQLDYFRTVNSDPLPEKLVGVSNIVLLVNTITNDDDENYLIPEIHFEGLVLYHNKAGVPYEESSDLFFDFISKFNDPLNPIIVTLQFRLGISDNGVSLYNLLEKAAKIKEIGNFKFKLYVLKLVDHETVKIFKWVPSNFFKVLKFIAFRFDTDYIPKGKNEKGKNKSYYYSEVKYHFPLNLNPLGNELEELHLGQKVRVNHLNFFLRKFPKLITLGVECYDLQTLYYFACLLNIHKKVIKTLTLRDGNFKWFSELKSLDKIILYGDSKTSYYSIKRLGFIREVHLYGAYYLYVDDDEFQEDSNLQELHISWDPQGIMSNEERDELHKLSSVHQVKLIDTPFLPAHCQTDKDERGQFHFYCKFLETRQ